MSFKPFVFDVQPKDLEPHILRSEGGEPAKDFQPEDIKDRLPNAQERKKQATALGDKIWLEQNSGYQFMPVALDGIQLWHPRIRVTAKKNIVETHLVERNGSVKEIVSTEDFVINIQGTIKRTDGLWPDEELGQLIEIWKKNEAIPIKSAITGRLLNGHEEVVIKSIDLPDRPGFVESIDYAIECISDIPFLLELNEDSPDYGNL